MPQNLRSRIMRFFQPLAAVCVAGPLAVAFDSPAPQSSVPGESTSSPQRGPRRARSPLRDVQNRVAVGEELAPFEARDQAGQTQSFETLKGPRGLYLVVVKSAAW